ncbi:unnamed protein product [Bursaphelenchus okinawaensis]|uniref:Activating signal cointegrator 1 complex subunit 3 n=1 Tax=Bursaphelenchus okinawaensis TaxID=465554 RepID=A0A811JW31_9BILA|nr:unnamed protein product [Bursaphelenchus okinawaensis]CAG9085064.1 unnamed protein product [Bursaphelenchus okinawaensis]
MTAKTFDIKFKDKKEENHVYYRFKRKVFEYLTYDDVDAAISLSKLFNFVEKTVNVFGVDNVLHRCLVVFKALVDCQEKPNSFELEYLRVHLSESLNEKTAESLCKAVSGVRTLVGMKHLHEQVANFWKEAILDPSCLVDPPSVVLYKKSQYDIEPEIGIISGDGNRILNEASRILGISISAVGQKPADAIKFDAEQVQWRNSVLEKIDFNDEVLDDVETNGNSAVLSADDLFVMLREYDQPTVLMQRLSELLNGRQSDDAIQQDLVDLLGVENFDLLQTLIENRKTLAQEIPDFLVRKVKEQRIQEAGPPDPTARYAGSVTIKTKKEAQIQKQMRKEEKKTEKEFKKLVLTMGHEDKMALELARAEQMKQRQRELQDANDFSAKFGSQSARRKLPFVFDAFSSSPMKDVDLFGTKFSLPEGTTRKITRTLQEVTVPPQDRSLNMDVHSVMISSLDPLGQAAFQGFEKLNTIQSIVFEQAYNTKENLLICAPTGAGKTNVAMLSILKTIRDHCDEHGRILKDTFKIIYIAPMKALAAEMTNSFSKRLKKLGLTVRELTGDTQLSRKEIDETQMLVLTPEKWDVVTRKSDDEALSQLVRLLIIDEVHLLHDERGPVIETIVARTLRQAEVSQQSVRIVGLSATLPNYLDVATFLRVDPEKGLFFFDGRFRPVPLTQTFVGVSDPNSGDLKKAMDEACYDKCIEYLAEKHQVLVFVHSRNATAQVANFLIERAGQHQERPLFESEHAGKPQYANACKRMKNVASKDLRFFFDYGIGLHHAGLKRTDRNLMEQMFSEGHIKVLCCTATLAWGVNLPAHAVIIRGTDVFDPNKGSFTDLGILDVQQIFGRAGRPQFESSGHGVIITKMAKLDKYLGMLIRKTPIESKFQDKIHDNLNAEIARGTVTNLNEAAEWLRYTYFYVRARINPIAYGIDYREVRESPDLQVYLEDLCYSAAQRLDTNQMIRFDTNNNYLSSTDLGRIASLFYITIESVETFFDASANTKLCEAMTDDQLMALLCSSSEFTQIQCRETEMMDLEMLKSGCTLPIRDGVLANSAGKVNCLLQNYISRVEPASFTLQTEMYYISQNASRVARALFECTLRKNWSTTAIQCLEFSKYINRKLWVFNSPLRQLVDVGLLKDIVVRKIEAKRNLSFFDLLEYDKKELGAQFHCDGAILYECLRMIPSLDVDATIKPITPTIVRIDAIIWPEFNWCDRLLGHGGAERFWLIVEDSDESHILHHEIILFNKKQVIQKAEQHLTITLPIEDHQVKHHFKLRLISDSWVVDETATTLTLNHFILPEQPKAHTDLLPLDPLPLSALNNPDFENLYPFEFFNPVQTQVFFALYNTWDNVLLGAPTSSGKTLCAELAIFRALLHRPEKKCVYIAPLKALVRERVLDWSEKFKKQLGVNIVEVSGDVTPQPDELKKAQLLITTPEKWDGITRSYDTRQYVQDVTLVVIDEIHLLGVERGAVLEAIVTRLKSISKRKNREHPVRIVGLSTALANAFDIADWLGVPESGLFNFRPSVRPVPIQVHIQGFPGQHYCPRMALMNKPAFQAIKQFSPVKPTLLFVASRRQTRLTAMAFVSMLALEPDPRQWLHMDQKELHDVVSTLRDENLKLTLPFGIGMHHAGLQSYERSIVERLFVERKIQVLIATATLAWGINCPAHLVIVKGTEFYDGKTHKYIDFPVTDVLQMIGRAGRPQYDDSAVAVVYVQDMKKKFYKRFLYEPFPVESALLTALPNHVNAEAAAGQISSKQQMVDYLSGTYLYRRIFANPSYYGIEDFDEKSLVRFLTKLVDETVDELITSRCVEYIKQEQHLICTPFGRLASKYYLEHTTIRHLAENLKEKMETDEFLNVLVNCPEYSEIPCRHNEDLINRDLNKLLPYKMPNHADFESSHSKTMVLYQTHFSRIQLPVDYLTDQRSVIESCIRIFQAILDFAVLKGWLSTSLKTIIMLQQVIQARWYDDHPLTCLPNVSPSLAKSFGKEMTIPMLQEELGIRKLRSEPSEKEHKNVMNRMKKRLPLSEFETKQVVEALFAWPTIRITDFKFQKGLMQAPLNLFERFEKQKTEIPLESGKEYRVKVEILIIGPAKNQKATYSPKYPKEKSPGLVLLLGEKDTNSVLACRKTGLLLGDKPHTFHLNFFAPESRGPHIFTLFVMSDSYLGIDQEYDVYCDVQ